MYLDCDVIVQGSLKELFEIDVSKSAVAMVEDVDGHAAHQRREPQTQREQREQRDDQHHDDDGHGDGQDARRSVDHCEFLLN